MSFLSLLVRFYGKLNLSYAFNQKWAFINFSYTLRHFAIFAMKLPESVFLSLFWMFGYKLRYFCGTCNGEWTSWWKCK